MNRWLIIWAVVFLSLGVCANSALKEWIEERWANGECRAWHFDGARNASVVRVFWVCTVSMRAEPKSIMEVPISEARYYELEAMNWKTTTRY